MSISETKRPAQRQQQRFCSVHICYKHLIYKGILAENHVKFILVKIERIYYSNSFDLFISSHDTTFFTFFLPFRYLTYDPVRMIQGQIDLAGFQQIIIFILRMTARYLKRFQKDMALLWMRLIGNLK